MSGMAGMAVNGCKVKRRIKWDGLITVLTVSFYMFRHDGVSKLSWENHDSGTLLINNSTVFRTASATPD